MSPFEKPSLPEVRPSSEKVIPDVSSDPDRYELPIPPDLVEDLLRKIDEEDREKGEGDEMPIPPTVH